MNRVEYVSRFVAVGLIAGVSLAGLLAHWQGVYPWDMDVYWDAAMRLRSGDELYLMGMPDDGISEYRYTPWFAYLWIPLTYLPHDLVTSVWVALMAAAALAVTISLVRRGWAGLALALLLGVQMAWWVRGGNVQPLMIAGLYFGMRTRSGPIAIAAAATLKIVPIAFVLVYVARREWSKVAWTIGATVALAAPLLLHDLSGYGSGVDAAATNHSLILVSPVLWAIVVAGGGLVAIWSAWRRSPLTSAWASVAALVALPRLLTGDLTLLLGGANPPPTAVIGERGGDPLVVGTVGVFTAQVAVKQVGAVGPRRS